MRNNLSAKVFLSAFLVCLLLAGMLSWDGSAALAGYDVPVAGVEQGAYQLLVIGPQAWVPVLQVLVDHKNDTGMPAGLLTMEGIDAAYSGYDLPEKIKRAIEEEHCLHEVKYVLLAGDTDVFPLRWVYLDIPTAPLSCAGGFPWRFSGAYGSSDLYYADLYESGGSVFESWDSDGDHKYGETGTNWCDGCNVDHLDLYMDVVVGRVPASTLQEMATYVKKVLRYEYMAGYGGAWTKEALVIAGSFGDSNTGSQAKKIAAKAPSLSTTILDHNASGCPASALPNRQNINDNLSDGTLLMVYLGHGAGRDVIGVGGLCDGSNLNYNVPNEIDAADGPDNAYVLPVVLDFACENGQYGPAAPWAVPYLDIDGIERDYGCNPPCFPTPLEPEEPAVLQVGNSSGGQPFDRDSTAEAFLVRAETGAIAEIATYAFGDSGNWQMAETFFQTYESGERILGELWKTTMHTFIPVGNVDNAWHFRHPLHYHLFGDPSLRVGGVTEIKGMPPEVTLSEPAADASIYSHQPDTNYGNTNDVGFMNYPGDYMSRALLRFPTPELPLSSTINLAKMCLYALSADPPSDWNELYELQDPWEELVVTWNNQPTWGTMLFSGEITPTQFDYLFWDVSSSVDGWANQGAPNNGWVLRGQEDTQYIYTFAAREHSNYPHPLLVVQHQPPCPAQILLDVILPPVGRGQDQAHPLYRLRDEVLTSTPRGRHYIDLFYGHSLELGRLLLTDLVLQEEGAALLGMALPGLEALVNGEGETVLVTLDMVEMLDIFLTHLHTLASPDLQADIEREWARANPYGLVDRTFAEAWLQAAGQWYAYLPLQFGRGGEPPAPEWFQFEGYVYLGEVGDTSNPLGGVNVVLYGSSGRFGPHELLTTAQTDGTGAFGLAYEATPEAAYAYYSLAIDDAGYLVLGALPGAGGEEWEPHWIQYAIPQAGTYAENAFFVNTVKR